MKANTESETPKMEKRFERFAKALMAVPKKELDKELATDERKKEKVTKRRNKTS